MSRLRKEFSYAKLIKISSLVYWYFLAGLVFFLIFMSLMKAMLG